MVNPSTTQLLPIPINTGMENTPTSTAGNAPETASDRPSFATRLNQVRSQRVGDDVGRRAPASRRPAPAREPDRADTSTETPNSSEQAASETADARAKADAKSTSADQSAHSATPTPAQQEGNAPNPAGQSNVLPAIPGHPLAHAQAQPAPVSAAVQPAATTAAIAVPVPTEPAAAAALPTIGDPTVLPPAAASNIPSLTSGKTMDSHATPNQAPASGIGIATTPPVPVIKPAAQNAAGQIPAETPALRSGVPATSPALPLTAVGPNPTMAVQPGATITAQPAPVANAQPTAAVTTQPATTAPAASFHQALTEQTAAPQIPVTTGVPQPTTTAVTPASVPGSTAALPSVAPQSGGAALPNTVAPPASGAALPNIAAPLTSGAASPAAQTAPAADATQLSTPTANTAQTTTSAPSVSQPAEAAATAAQRLNGIDRLLTLSNSQSGRAAVTANPVRPIAPARQVTADVTIAARTQPVPISAIRTDATPLSSLRTAVSQTASRAVASLPDATTVRSVNAVTPEPGLLSPTAVTARPAAQPAQAGNTSAALNPAQALKASAQPVADQAATSVLTPFADASTDAATAPVAVIQTVAAQAQAARDSVLTHESGGRATLPEGNLHPSSGAQSAVTSSAITASQAGSQANTDANSDQQDQPRSAASQADPVNANVGPGGSATQTVDNASGSTPTGGTAGAPMDQSQVIAQVTRHIETMRLLNGRGEITLQLRPDHLGSVRLTITNHADGVTAHIVTETALAQRAMESAGQQLHAALEARGLRLTTFDVSVGHGAADAGANTGGPRDTPQDRAARAFAGQRNTGHSAGAIDGIDLDAASDPLSGRGAGMLSGSSRLDYRA